MNIMLHEKRFLATLIDAGIGIVFAFLISILMNSFLGIRFMNYDYYFMFVFVVTMFLYQFFCLIFFKTCTIGLYLMSLKILSSNWEKVTIKQIILRSISISIPILFIVNLMYMLVYSTKTTTLFDDISDTMVVNTGINYHVDTKNLVEKLKKHK